MTAMTTPRHRVASATARLREIADALMDASVWSMDTAEAAATLVELTRLQSQVTDLTARVAAHADELQVGHDVGATSTANWLAHQTRMTRPAAAGVVRPGYDLAAHDHVGDALARGDLRVEQARVIIHGRFTPPTAQAARLRKMLLAIAAPKHQAATHGPQGAGVERRPGPERMGRAFAELIEKISAKDFPKVGGTDATVVVTIDLDTLTRRLEKAGSSTLANASAPGKHAGSRAPPGSSRVVLDGNSEVLDVGRARRFFTRAQLTAMSIRDGGCVADGCDWSPWLCHAHHWHKWADGGPTDLDNGGLLCPRHHARAHDPTYEMTHHPGGRVSFHRRP